MKHTITLIPGDGIGLEVSAAVKKIIDLKKIRAGKLKVVVDSMYGCGGNLLETILEKSGYVHAGQIVGIVAGTRTKSGATNFMRLHMIGDSESDSGKKKTKGKKDEKAKGKKKK